MVRLARAVAVGSPHHVTQRGNFRQRVFFTDDDRLLYLETLGRQCRKYGLDVVGYCLMTNHVHLVVVPHGSLSMARVLGQTHWRYSRYINQCHDRSGHLWQARYYSCAVERGRLPKVMHYLECNPRRAGMVDEAWNYRWSSAAAHCGDPDPSGLLDVSWWRDRQSPQQWRRRLARPTDEAILDDIRAHTRRGRPLGSDAFVEEVETQLDRDLRSRGRGRPKKSRDSHHVAAGENGDCP